MMCGILILGYGNTLRRDDGIGIHIVNELQKCKARFPQIHFKSAFQLDICDAREIQKFSHVVFIDAQKGKYEEMVRIEKIELQKKDPVTYNSHLCSIAALLLFSHRFYGKTPTCYSCAVKGCCFEIGEGLSPSGQAAALMAIEKIKRLLNLIDADRQIYVLD